MRVSGHKSESSIRLSLLQASLRVKQREISYALSSACSVENLESACTAISGDA